MTSVFLSVITQKIWLAVTHTLIAFKRRTFLLMFSILCALSLSSLNAELSVFLVSPLLIAFYFFYPCKPLFLFALFPLA